jgi:hypothetical protein
MLLIVKGAKQLKHYMWVIIQEVPGENGIGID